eukprot:168980_1
MKLSKQTKLSNYEGTKILKQLLRNGKQLSAIKEAVNIYNQIDEPKNHFTINTFLKICIQNNQPQHAATIWNDICKQKQNSLIQYPLLIQCFLDINIPNCMNILQWMNDNNHQLNNVSEIKDFSRNCSKLISKCETINQLDTIHSLLCNNTDIYIKTAFINAYSKYSQTDKSEKIFHSIPSHSKDKVAISAMLKAFINNGDNTKALNLYQQNTDLNDDVCHVLVLKACINTHQFDIGKQIHK